MPEHTSPVDLNQFTRANAFLGQIPSRFGGLSSWVNQVVSYATDPRLVPQIALEAMKSHPVVYLGDRLMTGIIRRPDIYSVTHADPRIVKETEEWLYPLLPSLLQAFARAYAYGAVAVIFDWDESKLKTRVPTGSGIGTRARNIPGHRHYSKAHEVRRDDVEVEVEGDEVVSVTYAGTRYPSSRSDLLLWDDEFGQLVGQGATRRAWRDYCSAMILDQLESCYLERSVDNPRVAFAPDGEVEIDGEKISVPEYVGRLLAALQGSGSVVFPQSFDSNGNAQYSLETLDIPDREGIWAQAIGRRETRILIAYLGLVGTGDLAAAASKTLDGLLKEFIQDIAVWVASSLNKFVEIVHAKNYDPDKVTPPEIEATDVGKASAKKLLAEVLRIVGSPGVSQWLDVPKALDRLGVPVLDSALEPSSAAPPPAAAPPGRPREPAGDREERRDDARTPEGEDATGAPDEGELVLGSWRLGLDNHWRVGGWPHAGAVE